MCVWRFVFGEFLFEASFTSLPGKLDPVFLLIRGTDRIYSIETKMGYQIIRYFEIPFQSIHS